MPRIIIYRSSDDEIDEAELAALLEAAGCEIIEEIAEIEDESEGLIVILTPALLDDDKLEEKLISATQKACPIVGIWPKGAASGAAPQSIDKYSTDQIVWDAERLRKALGCETEPSYDTPTGQPRKRPPTETNKCR